MSIDEYYRLFKKYTDGSDKLTIDIRVTREVAKMLTDMAFKAGMKRQEFVSKALVTLCILYDFDHLVIPELKVEVDYDAE